MTTTRTQNDMTSSSATQSSTTISSSPSSNSSIPLVPSSSLDTHHTGGHITCVIIGDSGVGKSSLVVSYTTNDFPTKYVPTAFDNYSVDVSVGTRLVHFDICDTGGKEQFSPLHGLCIPYSDVILLCFSVVNPQSFQNAITYWLSRARRSNSKIPIILVGTQMDLRSDLQTLLTLDQQKLKPVTEKEARARAQQMHACTYIECSSLTEKNLKTVFDTAVLTAIEFRDGNTTTTTTTTSLSSTSVLPIVEQQKQDQTTNKQQRTRHHHHHHHSHSMKTWRKLVSGCIGV
ncbi:unnamed protein product [Rotaria sordida]|uniref:Rho GTPase n=1 Tax=Rotaria sordida TaxID=392033 RepID=A0A814X200_9BILA|nr:unnamed protein product [Rotaria sordida]CAF0993822.1 unnamed protein product [Rotaria sordida]CAF1084909.1 unnamed protein product [Rotaria sordida]CAF1202786.1 unnamed protein product [Rotaria sordida]CAF1205616.1 unnamed protein product [Rotaria sordida]